MAKLTMTLFKKYLSTLNEEQAKAELALLFSKVSQVKEFYAKQQGYQGKNRDSIYTFNFC